MGTIGSGWDVARRQERCVSLDCGGTIGAGEQVYRCGPGRWPICVACAASRFDKAPPEQMPATSALDEWRAIGQRAGFVQAAAVAKDFKARQIAREPGEEG